MVSTKAVTFRLDVACCYRNVNLYLGVIPSYRNMTLLPSILHAEPKRYPLLILQSSLVQTSLPILRSLLVGSATKSVVFCLLYSPSTLVDALSESVVVHNWVGRVPGYQDADTHAELLSTTEEGRSRHCLAAGVSNLIGSSPAGILTVHHYCPRFTRYLVIRCWISNRDV